MNNEELLYKVKELGLKYNNHESDLYIESTKDSVALINNYKFKDIVQTYYSKLTNSVWHEIPLILLCLDRKRWACGAKVIL